MGVIRDESKGGDAHRSAMNATEDCSLRRLSLLWLSLPIGGQLRKGLPGRLWLISELCYCLYIILSIRCYRRVKRSQALRGRNLARDNPVDGAPMALIPSRYPWVGEGIFIHDRTPELENPTVMLTMTAQAIGHRSHA
jgi:hypothetical protein